MEEFIQNKIKQVFGDEYELMNMEPLLGGAQKHTFLAKCKNGFSFVIYKWREDFTYFTYDSGIAIFRSSSATLFEENNKIMIQNGVLTPRIYFVDRTRLEQNYDYAFVEYIDGVDLNHIRSKYPKRLPKAIESLTNNINKLHKVKSNRVGQVERMQDEKFDILSFYLENLCEDCDYLINNDKDFKKMYIYVKEKASLLVKTLSKSSEYTFIHGELGPNHVIVDKDNNAFFIDIEGAKFCDVEEENSFLKIRFNSDLKEVADEVDEDKMLFYHITHCFGNLRGAIELKGKGYQDIDDLNDMIEFFHKEIEYLMQRAL
ncbi:phosphotransferase [Clostridium butyricum]|uniref:phosphotransferase n=1 Tax=Clostridium butyricum TaxID=1492 RepID=UPI003D336C89